MLYNIERYVKLKSRNDTETGLENTLTYMTKAKDGKLQLQPFLLILEYKKYKMYNIVNMDDGTYFILL